MQNLTHDAQLNFFSQLKAKTPSHVSFVDEVAELLQVSNDSAYRRIRGEKELSLSEFILLCQKFGMSADQMLSNGTDTTTFSTLFVDHSGFNFDKYLADMLHQLELVVKASKKVMYYEAKDIPLFYYFDFDKLASFKYFFWMRTILGYEVFNKLSFEDVTVSDFILKTGKKITRTYANIPSVELWNLESVNVTLRQLKYYRESGVFKRKETVLELYDELESLIDYMQAQAECGCKFIKEEPEIKYESFELYINEVFLGHNTILAEADGVSTVFINHGVLNYMITQNSNFCSRTRHTIENTIRKSAKISNVGEKERQRFFHSLKHEVSVHRHDLLTHQV